MSDGINAILLPSRILLNPLHHIMTFVCVCVCVCDVEMHELQNFSDWVERQHDHRCSLETF